MRFGPVQILPCSYRVPHGQSRPNTLVVPTAVVTVHRGPAFHAAARSIAAVPLPERETRAKTRAEKLDSHQGLAVSNWKNRDKQRGFLTHLASQQKNLPSPTLAPPAQRSAH